MIKTKKIFIGAILLLASAGMVGCSNSAVSTHENNNAKTAQLTKPKAKASSNTSAKNVKSNNSSSQSNISTAVTSSSQTATSSSANNGAAANASYASSAKTSASSNTPVAKTNSPSSQTSTSVTSKDEYAEESNVLNEFFKTSGVQQKAGDQYIVTSNGDNNYQIELRQSGSDQNLSHLNAIYTFNTQTKQYNQIANE